MKENAVGRNLNVRLAESALLVLIILLVSSLPYASVLAAPTGANITYNITESAAAAPAGSIVTAGGSFTTLVLNGTYQTPRWKAYVGNVTGSLTLDDAGRSTIYDWNLVTISGEVYVSRNSSLTWSGVGCISNATLLNEQSYLNMSTNSSDNLNRTFNNTIHRSFYVGTTPIGQSACRALATYVNDVKQAPTINAKFQEVLLQDSSSSVIYATLLEDNTQGYNLATFDFQLIVPENEYSATPTPYYFYVEIS